MKRALRICLALSLFLVFIFPTTASAVSANPTPDCSAGTTCTITFTYTGDYYSWNVPSGVVSLTTDVRGAQGGGQPNGTQRGKGGRVQATISVTPGSTLYIYVGGSGANSATGSVLAAGGWNGGGTGGNYSTSGGGGGGASDIRVGGTSLSDRKIVAGGAGGFGYNGPYTAGGHGGGLNAQWVGVAASTGCITSTETSFLNEGSSCETPNVGVSFGRGGSQTAGGDTSPNADKGFAGSLGTGGNGGTGSSQCGGPCPGGGGGGGYYGGGGGGAGPGGGGSSYTDPVSVSSVTHTRGFNASNGSVAITYLNSPTPTTFSTSQSSPTNIGTGSTVSYSLVLSQSVSDLAAADFQFGGTSSCNTPGLSGSGTTYTVTVTNCSAGTLILQLKANSVTGTSAGPPSIASANTIIIDRTAPTVSVMQSYPVGNFYPGNTLTFNITMSETVTVSGTPRVPLTIGSVTRYANYLAGTNTKTLSFVYTVATDLAEIDSDSIDMLSPIQANGGSITDLAGNAMTVFTYTPPTLSVYVAQAPSAPTITSITPSNAQLSVAFTAGAANGSAITKYQYSTDNGANWKDRATGTTASPLIITTVSGSTSAIVNGTSYSVRLRGVSLAGNGESSTSISATPSAVVISGDATITTTYGQAASTGTYTSSGGTGPYTYTLSNTPAGVSISGGVVTASNTTAAGVYVQNVLSTDSASQVGTKQLTITVNKATTSISIALPGSASTAAAGGIVTITATVPRAGNVNFQLGGASISGCSSSAAASTTATCSWTAPGSLGNVNLTAIFTPTDTSNYETSTSTTLTISIVNGVSTISLSLAGGVTQTPKGQNVVITATIDQAGKVTFFVDDKKIPGCINLNASVGTKNCTWKPAVQKQVTLKANLNPTNNVYQSSTSSLAVWVVRRTGTR